MLETDLFRRPEDLNISTSEAKEMIFLLQSFYEYEKIEHRLYNKNNYVPENIIALYLYYINHSNYQTIIKNYKLAYIDGEAEVEPDVTLEERIGLALIYDYISNYDFDNKTPNLFIDALKMHSLLYSACPHPEFGGKLRLDNVALKGSTYEVIDAESARNIFQSYISKKIEYDPNNVMDYIDKVVDTIVDLIKLQPFNDGNKRTFRALLNLMLGKIGIPPIYIEPSEKEIYRDELLKAIETNNNDGIKKFYYYKICDSIIKLDLNSPINKQEKKGAPFIIK